MTYSNERLIKLMKASVKNVPFFETCNLHLQATGVISMIIDQCSIDIFFIDWENPRPNKADAVSAWRTYFVANEWNEIQVTRKTSLSLQVIVVLLILKVCAL